MSEEQAFEQAALSLGIESDGVAWLVFESRGERPNILSGAVLLRLEQLLAEVEAAAAAGHARALVVRSGRDGSFLAGADVREIGAIESAAAGEAGARFGQRLFLRLDRLPLPVVAAVDGVCLGGGTELILACDYRVAADRPETRIGLPEIRLGIIPGFGGTTRLPRLIGAAAALDLILTGRPVSAVRAERIGLIHERVPPPQLYQRARAVALELAEGGRPPRPRKGLLARLLDDTGFGRRLVLGRARKRVLAETRGLYPAPLAALEVVERCRGMDLEEALAIEARALGRLIVTAESRNLIRVFHLLESARKAGPRDVPARRVTRAAVLGAGGTGGGMAQLLAGAGIAVRLTDIRAEAPRGGFEGVDLVVEALPELLDVKQQVLREVESQVGGDCLLASTTSSLSITALARGLERPGNCCGLHFVGPVRRQPLAEVVRGEQTSDETVATAFALARALGKTPVIVRDGPGFLVKRVLAAGLEEAGRLRAEGASVEQIDRALLDFGMAMGQLRLADEIGLGEAGRVGSVPAARRALTPDLIRERVVLALVNEAARALGHGIVARPEDVDVAMIVGAGFPPFRGGLLRYADSLGTGEVTRRLELLTREHGLRFEPAPLLRELGGSGRGFYHD